MEANTVVFTQETADSALKILLHKPLTHSLYQLIKLIRAVQSSKAVFLWPNNVTISLSDSHQLCAQSKAACRQWSAIKKGARICIRSGCVVGLREKVSCLNLFNQTRVLVH